jgi:O-antigen/teichoic acid export membrane protein
MAHPGPPFRVTSAIDGQPLATEASMAYLQPGTIVFIGRVLQLLIGTVVGLLLPMAMLPADVGVYFLAQIAIAAGAVTAQAGLTFAIPAIVGQALANNEADEAAAACRSAILLCVICSLGVCLAGWTLLRLLPSITTHYDIPGQSFTIAVLAMIPFAALSAILVEMHRAARSITVASLLPSAQGGTIALLLVASLALAQRPTIEILLSAGLAGLAIATITGLAGLPIGLNPRTAPNFSRIKLAALIHAAWPGLLTSLVVLAVSISDQTIAGAIGGAVDAAHYGLGLRLAALLILPLGIVNATIIPHIVERWATGHRRRLQWLLTMTSSGATYCALVGLLALIIVGILGPAPVWDKSYAPALAAAVVLGLGQVIHTAGGSSGYLLLLLGQQKVFMSLSVIVGLPTILIACFAMAHFGTLGLALTMASGNAIQTLSSVILAKRLLGLDASARLVNPLKLRKVFLRAFRSS